MACGGECGRRAALLYLSAGLFLCRHCHDLTYASRRESKGYAALHKCQRIRRKLGGSANMTEPFPEKPKGKCMLPTVYPRFRTVM